MANELQFPLGQSGLSTIAANLYLSGGARTLAAGAIAMSDTGTPGMYWGTVPSGLAAGSYTVSVYNSATLVGAGDLEWDGSQQITSDTLLTAITALDVAAMAAAVWSAATRTLTSGGGATLAEIEASTVLAKAAEVAAVPAAVRTELATELELSTKLANLSGVGAALVVTPTSRTAGSVSQTITTVNTTTTVQEV